MTTNPQEATATMDSALTFVQDNLEKLARDLVELSETGEMPHDRALRELQRILKPISGHQSFSLAQRVVETECVKRVAGVHTA